MNAFDEEMARIRAIRDEIEACLPKRPEVIPTEAEDYIFTEDEENAWKSSEPDYTATKRIVTEIPTKQRRRVTLLKVTVPPRLMG